MGTPSADPAQGAAIHATERHVLVAAGPGSGKTRVLGDRLRWLMEEGDASPDSILALTFTNRAATELRERAGLGTEWALQRSRARRPFVGTFHGFCLQLLRREARHIQALPDRFTLLGGAAQKRVMRSSLEASGCDLKHFPAGDSLGRIQRARLAESMGESAPALGPLLAVKNTYETKLRHSGALDFDGLLIHTLGALRDNPRVRDHAQSRFAHVLVDEAQDTSPIQWEILRALGGHSMTIFAVGDPDQSIYGWRGADPQGLLAFADRFENAALYRLDRNYRSTATIVEASDALVQHNSKRMDRRLEASQPAGETILAVGAESPFDEARAIAKMARNLEADGTPWDEIAVLVRTGAQMRVLESCFTRENLPYRIHGASPFFERREIQDVLAYLRLIHNPMDQDAFWRVVEAPKRGVGPVSKKRLKDALDEMNEGVFWKDQVTLPMAIQSSRFCMRFQGRTQAGLLALGEFLESLGTLAGEPAHVALDHVLETLLESPWLDNLPSTEGSGHRREHLEALQQHAVGFHGRYPDDGIAGFLSETALINHRADPLPDGDGQPSARPALVLSTIHAAKGTEFDAVFVAGMEEDLMPHGRALGEPSGAAARGRAPGAYGEESTDALEEERRLLFVAMTRARSRLFLTWAGTRHLAGTKRNQAPSRFLGELPEHLMAYLDREHLDVLATARTSRDSGFQQGDRVEHAHYGNGTVVGFLSHSADARILIAFDGYGVQELFLAYTSLRRLAVGNKQIPTEMGRCSE